MKMIGRLLIMLLVTSYPVVSPAKDFDDSDIMHIGFPDWFVKSDFLDLTDELEKSKSQGKKGLMLLYTTEGCSYCSIFINRSLGDPEIAKRVQGNFDSIGMEIFDDTEMVSPQGEELPVKQFAKQEGVMFSPTLMFYGLDGKQILRKTGYVSPERFKALLTYIIEDHYKTEALSSYLKRVITSPASKTAQAGLIDNRHFDKPPYALDRSRIPASEPMLVIFERKDCPDCVDFHRQVLAEAEVDRTLEKFQVVRLDADDAKTPVVSPAGQRITAADWYKNSDFARVPAWILVDPNGNESMKTDALVLKQRMMNSLNYMLDGAYEKGWTYQRFARSQAIKRNAQKAGAR